MKKIIAPVDFSDAAYHTALFAADMAEFYGAELWLYHAYENTIPLTEYGYSYVSIPQLQETAEQELELVKTKIQSALRRTISIITRAENSPLAQGLSELCNELQPDMVVMGLSGKNALTRLVVGSNTLNAVHQLLYPVLVVPPGAEFVPVRKIGFACDYKKVLETTPVKPLKKLVHDLNAELFVLNIEDVNESVAFNKVKESRYAGELLQELKPSYQTIVSAGISNGINWFAAKEKIDWVVVVPKKHPLIEKIFTESHTKDLLHHTKLPVLCIHE